MSPQERSELRRVVRELNQGLQSRFFLEQRTLSGERIQVCLITSDPFHQERPRVAPFLGYPGAPLVYEECLRVAETIWLVNQPIPLKVTHIGYSREVDGPDVAKGDPLLILNREGQLEVRRVRERVRSPHPSGTPADYLSGFRTSPLLGEETQVVGVADQRIRGRVVRIQGRALPLEEQASRLQSWTRQKLGVG